jgi:DNA modification methylase
VDDAVSLHLGDCEDVLRRLGHECVDLTVTSPPYDDLRNYGNQKDKTGELFEGVFAQLFRVTKKGGVVVWVVGDATHNGSETGTSFRQALQAKKMGFKLHDTMVFLKENPPPTGGANRYYQAFEYMFVFAKERVAVFNPILRKKRDAWGEKRKRKRRPNTRDKDGNVVRQSGYFELKDNVKRSNVWAYKVSGGTTASEKYVHKHPAIFPERLARDHVLSWTNEGGVVLDPYMGSGTTGKMAVLCERRFIGIELNEEYFQIAQRRIKEAQERWW